MAQIDRNMELVRLAVPEIWNSQDPRAVDRLYSESYVEHSCWPDGPPSSKTHHRWLSNALKTMPPIHLAVEQVLAEGDRVAARYALSVMPQSRPGRTGEGGRRERVAGTLIFRFSGGRVREAWGTDRLFAQMHKLGKSSKQTVYTETL